MYSVQLSYATFGIEVKDGIVTYSASIGRWMVGKTPEHVKTWVESKGGKIIEV